MSFIEHSSHIGSYRKSMHKANAINRNGWDPKIEINP